MKKLETGVKKILDVVAGFDSSENGKVDQVVGAIKLLVTSHVGVEIMKNSHNLMDIVLVVFALVTGALGVNQIHGFPFDIKSRINSPKKKNKEKGRKDPPSGNNLAFVDSSQVNNLN